jgi:hypothetical protein
VTFEELQGMQEADEAVVNEEQLEASANFNPNVARLFNAFPIKLPNDMWVAVDKYYKYTLNRVLQEKKLQKMLQKTEKKSQKDRTAGDIALLEEVAKRIVIDVIRSAAYMVVIAQIDIRRVMRINTNLEDITVLEGPPLNDKKEPNLKSKVLQTLGSIIMTSNNIYWTAEKIKKMLNNSIAKILDGNIDLKARLNTARLAFDRQVPAMQPWPSYRPFLTANADKAFAQANIKKNAMPDVNVGDVVSKDKFYEDQLRQSGKVFRFARAAMRFEDKDANARRGDDYLRKEPLLQPVQKMVEDTTRVVDDRDQVSKDDKLLQKLENPNLFNKDLENINKVVKDLKDATNKLKDKAISTFITQSSTEIGISQAGYMHRRNTLEAYLNGDLLGSLGRHGVKEARANILEFKRNIAGYVGIVYQENKDNNKVLLMLLVVIMHGITLAAGNSNASLAEMIGHFLDYVVQNNFNEDELSLAFNLAREAEKMEKMEAKAYYREHYNMSGAEFDQLIQTNVLTWQQVSRNKKNMKLDNRSIDNFQYDNEDSPPPDRLANLQEDADNDDAMGSD